MKILAFDTSNSLASVAILINGELKFNLVVTEESKQAEKLFKLISQALNETGLTIDQLDYVAVTNGPGSFTGVRIGLAAALGMRMFTKAKFVSLSNFQVLAYYARQHQKNSIVMLDARREQIYVQAFDQNLFSLSEPVLLNINKDSYNNFLINNNLMNSKNSTPDVAQDKAFKDSFVLLGDGARFFENDNQFLFTVNAEMLASCVEYYVKKGLCDDSLSPLYIREPDAVAPK